MTSRNIHRTLALDLATPSSDGASSVDRSSGQQESQYAGFMLGSGEAGLVSVVIPTYNRAYIIADAIKSVLAQTYLKVEIIVVDDGSTDATGDIVSEFAEVRLLKQKNSGVAGARNRGLVEARGEFIALLDSDDAWMAWKLEAQIAVLKALPNVGMIWTDMTAVDEAGHELHERYLRKFYPAHGKVRIEDVCNKRSRLSDVWSNAPISLANCSLYVGDIASAMFLGNLVHTSTVLIRRDRLRVTGLFNEELRHSGEDYDFHLRTSMHGPVAFHDEPSIVYRIGASDQLTRPDMDVFMARNNLTTVRRCLESKKVKLPSHVVRDRLAESYAWVGAAELRIGERKRAARDLLASLSHRVRLKVIIHALFTRDQLRTAKAERGR
jgi:glycosyltransferase involved in cell wall biosynthesis